ncbi:Hypothetical protein D9617_90g064660 [Elsinoe fawcettii]|nr:Hypothetical protein D9617_90g064660 [Elsinoe fawcettii]
MYPPTELDIPALFKKRFEDESLFRTRIYFGCVTGEEIAVAVDAHRKCDVDKAELYSNLFVPTVCGRCRRRQAARASTNVLLVEPSVEDVFTDELDVEISNTVYEGWAVLRAVQDRCDGHLETFARLVDHRIIEREIKRYSVQLHSAELTPQSETVRRHLRYLPFFDPQFL